MHPESRGRVAEFHRWLPHVLTDHHEMGTDSTFFFQPGVPSRTNPHTPAENVALTREIAAYHVARLDEERRLYFSEEQFDDFYYGKGSTYPDVHGCIGILFEQASARGHVQDNPFGELTLPFAIQNQFWTTLTTLDAAVTLRDRLLEHQRDFFAGARAAGAADPRGAYVVGERLDTARLHDFVDLLLRHQVEVYQLAAPLAVETDEFVPGHAFVVPLEQRQYRLLQALFETQTEFQDDTFYDVSTWTMPLAYDLAVRTVGRGDVDVLRGDPVTTMPAIARSFEPPESAYAYAFSWAGRYAPRAAHRLLAAGARLRVAPTGFHASTHRGDRGFPPGTILVPTGPQDVSEADLQAVLRTAATLDGIDCFALASGWFDGADAGSPSFADLVKPTAGLLIGGRVSAYQAGEVWHHLDVRLGMPVSLLEVDRLTSSGLADLTHVILVSGADRTLTDAARESLSTWIRQGGVLIAQQSAATFAREEWLGPLPENPETPDFDVPADPSYGEFDALAARQRVAGAIFQVELDRTHPLAFGFPRSTLPIFRNSAERLAAVDDPFALVARYTESPLLSGFADPAVVTHLAGTPAVLAVRVGRGAVICLADNVGFRGTWPGTSKLLANALFFGHTLKATRDLWPEPAGDSR